MAIKLLVIDDDSAVTDLLTLLLKSQGFEVFATNNSAEGLGMIRELQPDLVVLDLMMPEMDGWEVCRSVRQFSQVPIIILSALNDPSMIASVLDAGADDYLTKPTPSRVLVTLDKRAHNPYLVASGLADKPTPMPWLGHKQLIIQFA